MELSDYAVVQNILGGNEHEFSIVFTKYKNLVYTIARRFLVNLYDIEDVCQEVFLRVFKSLKLFNQEYRLSTWIATITKNLCITKVKRQVHYIESMDTLNQNGYVFKNDITPEEIIIDNELFKYLRLAVMELPEIYQQPIILYYFKGFSYNELTVILNLPMTIVKNRIYRAKVMLNRKMSAIILD